MSKRSGNYPDWVLKYKERGTFVNKSFAKDGTVSYYLYRGHSEREKGTGKVRRVVDECLGKITEKDGFIPARHRLPERTHVTEFGRSRICVFFTEYILPGLQKTYGDDARKIYAASILFYIYGTWSADLFRQSWLSIRFPDILLEGDESSLPPGAVHRVSAMITHIMGSKIGTDLPTIMAFGSMICLIATKGSLSCSFIPAPVSDVSEKFGISWKEELWEAGK